MITSTKPIFTTMLKVNYLSTKEGTPAKGYWDMAFLDDLLRDLPDSERQVFIIPGAYQFDKVAEINEELSKHSKVLVFITSDEEGKFPCDQLHHIDMVHFCQYGHCKRPFPIGYTTETRKHLKQIGLKEKTIDTFYAGQLNSYERKRLFAQAAMGDNNVLLGTNGFSKGFPPEVYYDYMAQATSVLTPGGWVSPDSFRFYEALEAGCIPVGFPEYARKLFPDMPGEFFGSNNQWFAWWIGKKMQLRQQIKDTLGIKEALTVVVPTSYIPSHPSTEIIDQTIASIRHHTGSDIILTIDGLRPEHEEMSNDYTEYIRRLLWKCNFEYENVYPILFDSHTHQVGMMKEALKHVATELVLYVEHDTPLVTDESIDWQFLISAIMRNDANVIRFHFEAKIPEEHEYLMVHDKDMPYLVATKQWSQRPHLARTEFYRGIMRLFSENANCFIEDFIHGRAQEGNWDDWRIFIYSPDPINIKRSLNLDGRAGGAKYDDKQIW